MDPAHRDLAVIATKQARERANLLDSLLRSRAPGDLAAARLGLLLAVVEPIIVALEALLS